MGNAEYMGVQVSLSSEFHHLSLLIIFKMSWQTYVDTQMMEKKLKQAAIAGLDGSIWAKSAEFNITPEDVKKVLTNYNDTSAFAVPGLTWRDRSTFSSAATRTCCVGSRARVESTS